MASGFQKEVVEGIIIGFFKTITLQYVNPFQLSVDQTYAYNLITNQLYYCKGDGLSSDTRKFVYDTIIWFELLGTLVAIIQNIDQFLAGIVLSLVSLFSGDLKTVGYIHGKLLKIIYDVTNQIMDQ